MGAVSNGRALGRFPQETESNPFAARPRTLRKKRVRRPAADAPAI